MLKLASLAMFSLSLGQTILCIGRNKTSCESYGYNVCDYQVAGGPHKTCPLNPIALSPWGLARCHEQAWGCLPLLVVG